MKELFSNTIYVSLIFIIRTKVFEPIQYIVRQADGIHAIRLADHIW